jgi:hypothetical protein
MGLDGAEEVIRAVLPRSVLGSACAITDERGAWR